MTALCTATSEELALASTQMAGPFVLNIPPITTGIMELVTAGQKGT